MGERGKKRKKQRSNSDSIDNKTQIKQRAKADAKRILNRNKYFWLVSLCALYFLKAYHPAFAWFGAFGALGFYKNSNPILRKLIYLSLLGLIGLIGFFV